MGHGMSTDKLSYRVAIVACQLFSTMSVAFCSLSALIHSDTSGGVVGFFEYDRRGFVTIHSYEQGWGRP